VLQCFSASVLQSFHGFHQSFISRSGSGHKQKEEMDTTNDISKELSCMDIYDAHSFCISVRSQLNQIRRYGKLQSCDVLFQDWKKCMYAKLTADVDKKQVSNKYYVFNTNLNINLGTVRLYSV
jgi:hypothetical protein